ncbi:MAG TPA: K(+)-transporting ATPase subunit C [Acidimicrobiales bacterium]|nr:K(+)-transporting ATPase subunit C [Acidimicrobiales bacterium]
MRRQLLTGLRVTLVLVVLLGVLYPLAVWGVGRVAFKAGTDGSFVSVDGKVVGSSLIGQAWNDKDGHPLRTYFQPRPSAAGDGYDAASSGGTNLGPSNKDLLDAVAQRVTDYRDFNGLAADAPVPVDAVTSSGSGLDPDISVANALAQAPRVALARGLSEDTVTALVRAHTRKQALGILGEKAVNVLDLNLALDAEGK